MTANVPCSFSARSVAAEGDNAVVHTAASTASGHLVDVAQLRHIAASSTRTQQRGGTGARQQLAGGNVKPVDVNGGLRAGGGFTDPAGSSQRRFSTAEGDLSYYVRLFIERE